MGLSAREVLESRERHGANRLAPRKQVGFWNRFLHELGDPIIRILLIAVGIRLLFSFRECDPLEIGGILLAVLLSSGVSAASECGSARAFARLSDASRGQCRVRREGKEEMISTEDVVVGDRLLLGSGDRVPADGILLSGELSLELSRLNGESGEQVRTPGSFSGAWSLDDPHQVFSGAGVSSGAGEVEVLAVGDKTMYGALAFELQNETRDSPLKVRLAHLARDISRIGYVCAAIVGMLCLLRVFVFDAGFVPSEMLARIRAPRLVFSTLLRALTLAITVIVVAVPEGLPMMITVVLSSNMRRMLRDRVLVKKLVGIETAGSLDLLFTDKTGTLTEGNLSLVGICLSDGTRHSPSALGKRAPVIRDLLAASAHLGGESRVQGRDIIGGNATDRAMLAAFRSCRVPARRKVLLPFRSDLKYSAVSLTGAPCSFIARGAPEYLLPYVETLLGANGEKLACEPSAMTAIERAWHDAASRGERVIAVVSGEGRELSPSGMRSLSLIALLSFSDRLRRGAEKTVREMQGAGIRVVMMTGDNRETAAAIARAAGILGEEREGAVLDGEELRKMDDDALRERLPALRVISRAIPSDKVRLVRVAQERGHVVGMTGDGVNDAPALKLADVGFAMGSGTDVAKEASDIVLLDNSIASISRAVLYGRTIFSSIRKFITFQLMMNLCAVGVSVFGQIVGIESPITVMQMLWVNLIMDTLGGLAFAGEPPQARAMREMPKRREERILSRSMCNQIAITGGVTLFLSCFFLRAPAMRAIFGSDSDGSAFMTAFFAFFIFAGLANCFNARSDRIRFLSGIGGNRPFLFILFAVSLIQIFMIYRGGVIFGTVPLPPRVLLRVIGLSLLVIPADLLRKCILRLSGTGKERK